MIKIDLSGVPEDELWSRFEQEAATEQAALKLEEGRLLRPVLFQMPEGHPNRLLLIIHHLAVDGVSWRILLGDLNTVSRQLLEARAVALPLKTTSFREWALKTIELARDGALNRELEYWLAKERNQAARLPVDFPGGRNDISSSRNIRMELSQEETEALLQGLPKLYKATINDALVASLARTITEWACNQYVLIDLEGHGREDIDPAADLTRTVGWFTALFPVLLEADPSWSAGETLSRIREQLQLTPNNGVGYGLLRYGSDNSVTPL